jgi:hypothetical protein
MKSSPRAASLVSVRRSHDSGLTAARYTFALAAAISLSAGTFVARADAPATPTAPPTPPVAMVAPAAPKAPAPVKVVLRYKAQAGQIERVHGTALLSIAGAPVKLSIKQVDKLVFTRVDPATGDLTVEDTTESSETSVGGQPPKPDKPATPQISTFTIHPNGMLVSYKSSETDKDQATLDARLHQATSIVFPERAVTVGDKWSQDFKGDAALGTRPGHADFEIVSATPVAGADAFKIKMTYSESGASPITGKGTYLIETATGDELASDYDVDGLSLSGAIASGSLHSERVEGGPLSTSKNDVAAATVDSKKEQTIDDKIKDGFEKLPGVVTLYRKTESGRDQIYAELREDQIGKIMMLQATASTGTAGQIVEGDPIDDLVFKFTRTPDDRIVLTVPNFWYRADAGTPVGRSVRRSFADAFLQSFRIEAKQADRKSVLIDVSELFKGDISQISQAFAGGGILGMPSMGGGYGMDREKTYIQTVKNFPDNLVVSTQYNFIRMGRAGDDGALADGRSAPIVVTYNLFTLPVDENYQPTNGYKPRLADPRVGYFTGGAGGGVGPNFMSFNDDSKEDPYTFYIERWDLKKKDPLATVSEPVKPIVFWIDNAVPTEYRDAVRAGLLTWNKAFEKLGFKNAVVVNQMPDNPDPKDATVPSDTADMRFNMIRWVTSPAGGYAVALARANPLTGQILNASITVDAGIVRYTKLEHKDLIEPAQAFEAGAGIPIEEELLKRKAAGKANYSAMNPMGRFGFAPNYCELGPGLKEQAWFGDLALNLLGPASGISPIDRKDYINQFVHEVVSHEMGHIMGLRHNFAGSTEFSLADLSSPSVTNEGGIGASVMDYNPFNIMALRHKGVPYYAQTVGAYDLWAIQYGYTDIPSAKTAEDELPVLKRIASLSAAKGHAYASDEIADQFDPLVTRFDLSSDPVAYWHKNMDLCRYLLVNLDKRLPKPGESYWEFTQAFNQLLGMYARGAGVASRYVGGLNINRNHKGDPHEKPSLLPIDAAKQKEALSLLNTYIFSPDALQFPKRYYTEFTTDPFSGSYGQDFPIQDQIASLQRSALKRLFSGSVLNRVANNEFKMGSTPAASLSMSTLFNSVSGNVWAELDAHRNVPTMRRQLQRSYVDTMIDMVTGKSFGVPEDAKMLAWNQLRGLRERIQTAQKSDGSYDDYTRIHLADSLTKVNRALNAGIMLNSGSSGGPTNLLQMLLGGDSKATTAAP